MILAKYKYYLRQGGRRSTDYLITKRTTTGCKEQPSTSEERAGEPDMSTPHKKTAMRPGAKTWRETQLATDAAQIVR